MAQIAIGVDRMRWKTKAALAAIMLAPFALSGGAANARNYDCSKAGNANKAVCKSAAQPAPAAPLAPANKPAAQQRNYDCSKPGNANKVVCKGAVKPAAPVAAKPAAPVATTRNYDCSKPGNANKTVCKNAAPMAPAPRPTVASRPAAVAPAQPTAPVAPAQASGPQGATARCKDGSFSHSAHHSGSCSHHGGVAQFFQ